MIRFAEQHAIYWYDSGGTAGSEFRKVRPCIIVSSNEMNKVLSTVVAVPLTSISKDWTFRLTVTTSGLRSSAACDQLRSIDNSRLKAYVGHSNLLQRIFT